MLGPDTVDIASSSSSSCSTGGTCGKNRFPHSKIYLFVLFSRDIFKLQQVNQKAVLYSYEMHLSAYGSTGNQTSLRGACRQWKMAHIGCSHCSLQDQHGKNSTGDEADAILPRLPHLNGALHYADEHHRPLKCQTIVHQKNISIESFCRFDLLSGIGYPGHSLQKSFRENTPHRWRA